MPSIQSCCLIVAALLLSGCSDLQHTRTSGDETPASAQDTPSPPLGMDKSPLATTDAEIAPVLDENNVYFASGSTVVDQAGKEKLRRHAEDLKQNQKKILTLAGHTDDTGSRNYNLAIAEERLMNVSRLLLAYGAPARQIRRNRIGNIKKPPACKTAECREKMRRVELIYLP